LEKKALSAISSYKIDMVVANELHSRRTKVILYSKDSKNIIEIKDSKEEIEGHIIRAISKAFI